MDSGSPVTATATATATAAGSADAAGHDSRYRDLQRDRLEIRLLIVEPGSRDDSIDCTFEHTSLADEHPRAYETVSYVWGDPNIPGSISLYGEPFVVPASSEAVIRRMRLKDQQRCLWVDAVCINQGNNKERSIQVAMMHEIYSKTTRNLIWLGEDANSTNNAAQQVITAVLEDMKRETNGLSTVRETLYSPAPEFHPRTSRSRMTIDVDWTPFFDYFASPWFGRLWVVQEAALPEKSICIRGSSETPLETPLEDVLRAAAWVVHKAVSMVGVQGYTKAQRTLWSANFIFAYADRCGRYHSSASLIKDWYMSLDLLLNDLSDFKAQNPRDHIYGVLGIYGKFMRSRRFPPALVPDYDLSCEEIFRGVAKYILRREARLDSLKAVRRWPNETDAPDFPSWVTRWHHASDENPDSNEGMTDFSAGEAIKPDTAYFDVSNDPKVLSLKGIPISSITKTGSDMTREQFAEDRKRGARLLKNILKEASELVGSSDIRALGLDHDKVATTLISSTDGYRFRISDKESADLFNEFLIYVFERKYYPPRLGGGITEKDIQAAKAASYWQALTNTCFGRRLFTTDLGHLGVGPSQMMPGDLLVVLFGGECPFVLRPVDLEADRYELVGHCWAYGIMNGEATDTWAASGELATNFHLV